MLRFWYRKTPPWFFYFLLPFEFLYRVIIYFRRLIYKNVAKQPVIVVGNLTVGGTGKTPCVIAIVRELLQQGYKPGIVSRGYGGKANSYPQLVTKTSLATEVGDEALLLYQKTKVPVMVDLKRARAVQHLLQSGCDVIVSDDGLQHHAMGRAVEIAVIDGERRFGNRHCLPVGPLREPMSRLRKVDYRICNGNPLSDEVELKLKFSGIYRVKDGASVPIDFFANKKVHAVAGIGNPQRFFAALSALNLSIIPHPFRDHYRYRAQDFNFLADEDVVIMTEKDAVKCRGFADERFYFVAVEAQLPADFLVEITQRVASVIVPSQSAPVNYF